MAESELSILLKLIDNASAEMKSVSDAINTGTENIKSSMEKASTAVNNFSNNLKQTGRAIGQISQSLRFFGIALTGPFILALKNSAEHSAKVTYQLNALHKIFDDLQKKVAIAVLPILEKFTGIVKKISDYIGALSPALVNNILQVTLMVGIYAILTSIFGDVVKQIIFLVSGFTKIAGALLGLAAANPGLTITIGLVVALIIVMFRFKTAADLVMSTFEILFLFLKNGFNAIVVAILGYATIWTTIFTTLIVGMVGLIDVIQKFPSITNPVISTFEVMFLFFKNGCLAVITAFKLMFKGILEVMLKIPDYLLPMFGILGIGILAFKKNIQETLSGMAASTEGTLTEIENTTSKITGIFTTGSGSWVKALDPVKESLKEIGRRSVEASTMLQLAMQQSLTDIENTSNTISTIVDTGVGKWSKMFDAIKIKIGSTVGALKDFLKSTKKAADETGWTWKKAMETISTQLSILSTALTSASAENKKYARAAKAVALAMAIVNTALAVTNALSVQPFWVGLILAGVALAAGLIQVATIAGQEFHEGGMIRAHEGLAVDEVPIIAQTGEGVLSRRGMAALGGEGNLNRLNAGQGGGSSNTSIYIENALFRNDNDTEDTLLTISRLIEQKRRARV